MLPIIPLNPLAASISISLAIALGVHTPKYVPLCRTSIESQNPCKKSLATHLVTLAYSSTTSNDTVHASKIRDWAPILMVGQAACEFVSHVFIFYYTLTHIRCRPKKCFYQRCLITNNCWKLTRDNRFLHLSYPIPHLPNRGWALSPAVVGYPHPSGGGATQWEG